MAGIGFELKKILKKQSIAHLLQTYGYAAILSSGPWILSMLAILGIGIVYLVIFEGNQDVVKFQLAVTYVTLMASSLLFTGFFQLPFTRFIADRIYEERSDWVLPNFFGMLVLIIGAGFIVILPLSMFLFYSQSNLFIIVFNASFLVVSAVWLTNIMAVSIKKYKTSVLAYFVGYGTIFILAVLFKDAGIEALLASFLLGNIILLSILLFAIVKEYDLPEILRFDFLKRHLVYWSLGFSGFFYNLGVWTDKIVFWYHPDTGQPFLDRLHASFIYDMPIFLAYLSIIPGMAVFFYRLEADFAETYKHFYDAIRGNKVLSHIKSYKNDMIDTIRHAIREIIVVQGFFALLIFNSAPKIFDILRIPRLSIPIFNVSLVATQLQLGFLAMLAILFYLDRRKETLRLVLFFLIVNLTFSLISIELGPYFYGYGFALATLISFTLSLTVLKKVMENLDYETYMLQ